MSRGTHDRIRRQAGGPVARKKAFERSLQEALGSAAREKERRDLTLEKIKDERLFFIIMLSSSRLNQST